MGKTCDSSNRMKENEDTEFNMNKPTKKSQFQFKMKDNEQRDGEQTRDTKIAVARWFPGALRGKLVEEIAYEKLAELGFTNTNTLYGDCSCPDEINHNDPEEDVSSLFRFRWGQIFKIGGIGGIPHAGKTGWGAFSSHTPQNGNIVVVFAPHVGIDCDGNVGKVHRQGIDHSTTACGAAIGAYNAVKDDKSQGEFKNGFHDHQMDSIKNMLVDHVDSIKGRENEMAVLPYKMFEIIE